MHYSFCCSMCYSIAKIVYALFLTSTVFSNLYALIRCPPKIKKKLKKKESPFSQSCNSFYFAKKFLSWGYKLFFSNSRSMTTYWMKNGVIFCEPIHLSSSCYKSPNATLNAHLIRLIHWYTLVMDCEYV